MRKIFFALLLAIVGTTMAMAYNYGYRKVDYVPDVGHFTWHHHLDQSDNKFYFTDNYHLGVGVERKYIVHVYERKPGQSSIIVAYRMDDPSECWYHYGVLTPNGISVNEIGQEEYTNSYDFSEFDDEGHTGGDMLIDLSDVIQKAKQQNYTELRIVVEELTREKWQFRSWYPVETERRSDCGRGLFHNNYLDVDLPVVQVCDIQASATTVKYGENFNVTALYKASHPARLIIQYTDSEGPTYPDSVWVDLAQKTLTADDAKKGCQFVYKRAFTGNGMAPVRRYRLKAVDQVRGTTQYSGMETVTYKYKLEDGMGQLSYFQPGETVVLPHPSAGMVYHFTSDIPVATTSTSQGYEFDMPACNVIATAVNKLYTVRFYDYDYTLLREQQIGEGLNAVPPTTPTHAGMTFTGWDGEYTNIQKDIALHALYSVEGVEVKLAEANDLTYVKEGDKINLNIYVKTPNAVTAKAYIQNALLETEDQENLNWSENSTSINFTAAQAQAGTTQVKENQTVFANGSYGRARYFRVRVRVGSSDIYSNVIRIDTYYPITINGDACENLFTEYLLEGGSGVKYFLGNGTIYARPGDPVMFIDADAVLCELSLYLANGTPDSLIVFSMGGYTATGIYLPTDYGSNAITVSHKKHTVLFYAAGHVDGYWNLIHGDGVYEPQEVLCGGTATPPEVNDIPNKVFRGWKARGEYGDEAYADVTEDMAFDAILEDVPTFTVTFNDWDGTLLNTQEVAIGESAMPPLVEYRYGYDFIGWDKDISCVTEAMTVTAQYEAWPESIEDIVAPVDKARKYLINGEIYIANPDGKIYNAQGAQVK